jgi:hypothetical protein
LPLSGKSEDHDFVINLKADFDPLTKDIDEKNRQLPFAIALTLTKVAQDGQAAGRKEEGAVFRNRNDWTVRNTKITPAKKTDLVAEVYTDTANRQTGAPDYLVGQEDGRERVPIQGRQHIAIPTKFLYQLIGGQDKIIPDWLRPKAMLGYASLSGNYVNRRGKTVRGNAQTRGYYFFLVRFKSGKKGIMARQVNDPPNAALPMYVFVTHANIRKRLHLQDDVAQAIDVQLQKRWDEALMEVFGVRA